MKKHIINFVSKFTFSLAAFCVALTVTSSFAQSTATNKAEAATRTTVLSPNEIRTALDQRIAEKRAKGVAVAVIEADGRVQFVNAGESGRAGRTQIDEDTIFEIGSITKVFTGILLAQAVERGEMKLTDTVRMHAPKSVTFPQGGVGDITMQQLVTHTSGLPRLPMGAVMIGSMMADAENPYKNFPTSELWKYLVARKHDATKVYPSDYSNLGMGLLGELLANRAGMSFAALVERDITKPLGMMDTFVDVPENAMQRFAIGHTTVLTPTKYWDLPALPGAGALRSTTLDMAKFTRAQVDGTLPGAKLSHTTLAKMDERNDVAYAWMRLTARGDVVVWHNGGTGGFRTFAGYSEKSNRAVVVLENSGNGADDLARHFLNPAFRIFPPDESPRFGMRVAVTIAITAIAALTAFILPWNAKYLHAPIDVPRKNLWHAMTAPWQIHSKFDALWLSVSILCVAALVALFGPWKFLGQFAKWSIVIPVLVSVVVPLWRARALPMRNAVRLTTAQILGRVLVAALAIVIVYLLLS